MRILSKKLLVDSKSAKVDSIEILSPEIASKIKPGQFVVIMASEKGEKVPLTVVEKDAARGTIKLIFQEVGLTTKILGAMKAGDRLYSIVGPLGNPTQIKKYGKIIIIGGGVGIAEIYPVARAMKEAGNHVTTILGARSKELLILENELKAASDELYVVTDDGSYGRRGFTTDMLEEILSKNKYDLIYSVGPIPMMKNVSLAAKKFSIRTIVSLNAIMVDATGMCGCCRVTVGGKTYFSCVDGPEFDASLVDWEELIKRNKIYNDKEKHICKLDTLQQ